METAADVINGVVEGIVYRNAENGYSVLDISHDGKLITAVGALSCVDVGEELSMRGEWVVHPTFGRQFKVSACERKIPKSAGDMLRYLSSGAVKGIGPATAKKIVERFGNESFEILENSPHLLAQIKGISEERAKEMSDCFKNQFAVREVMIYLEKYGMSPSECLSVYKALGSNAVERITGNPYLLCSGQIGLSFTRADEIAAAFSGVNPVYRERAGIIHIISHNLMNGHTCLPRERIIEPAGVLLEKDSDEINRIIDALIEDKDLVTEDINGKEFLFLPYMYMNEKRIADRIKVMLRFPPPPGRPVENDIDRLEEKQGIKFEELQRQAIMTAVKKGLLVLTGGPGTGKTTTLNGIIEMFEKRNLRVLLAAPTGRAAKRMSEVTGREAKTLHRLLEVVWGENERQHFSRNVDNPLECDAVIVDELSMVDVQLFWGLLDALPLGCRLIMVGDSDQLPAVGAGNILHDIIDSGLLPVVALNRVFRQAMESLIVKNAHRIVRGENPVIDDKGKDFFFLSRENLFSAASTVVDLYTKRLTNAYGYDSINDIQIICPSRKGELGTVNLNRSLQQLLNPPSKEKDELQSAGRIIREGDKVMQIKNNYDIVWTKGKTTSSGIFNGDIGIVQTVNHNSRFMKIQFDDKTALYPFENAKELEHAYAVTVHKSQGCEFEAVIMPVCGVVEQLKYRNLLYTAVTRAKSLMIIVGSKNELFSMVANDRRTRRYTALKHFLTKDVENEPEHNQKSLFSAGL